MPQSANREALLGAVEVSLRELEMICGRLERALMTRTWLDLDAAIADARRVTHALQNAMDDAQGVRDEAFNENVRQRLAYVAAIRQNQMVRLHQYRDAVGERLNMVTRWKNAMRSLGRGKRGSRRSSVLDRLT